MTVVEKVKKWIVEDIHSGQYPRGSRLPTRHELMKKYNVARATIDKVIGSLCDEGITTSARGSGTFVQGTEKQDILHVYFVVNTDREGSIHSQTWMQMMEKMNRRISYSVLVNSEVETAQTSILRNKGSRIIWNRASLSSYSLINTFEKTGVPQLLINRSHPQYSFIATDTKTGIAKALTQVKKKKNDARIDLLLPPLNPERPFLAERETLFHETALDHKLTISSAFRAKNTSHESIINAVQACFNQDKIPDYIFIPEITMVPHVLTVIRERKIDLGKDIGLILTDWQDSLNEVPGLICLEQQWEQMFSKAFEWVLGETKKRVQILIEPKLKIS